MKRQERFSQSIQANILIIQHQTMISTERVINELAVRVTKLEKANMLTNDPNKKWFHVITMRTGQTEDDAKLEYLKHNGLTEHDLKGSIVILTHF